MPNQHHSSVTRLSTAPILGKRRLALSTLPDVADSRVSRPCHVPPDRYTREPGRQRPPIDLQRIKAARKTTLVNPR